MTRNRFKTLTSILTFDDVSTKTIRAKDGKFYLMSSFFEIIRNLVVDALSPGQNLCIDENYTLSEDTVNSDST